MTSFDPVDSGDQERLAQAIRGLPAATAEEIEARFAWTQNSWNQGDRPLYIQPGDLEERLRSVLSDACSAVEEKTSTTGIKKDPDGTVFWVKDSRAPYYGSSWGYETLEDEKLLQVNLSLEREPSSPSGWVPFVFMRRSDGVLAFWFDDSI